MIPPSTLTPPLVGTPARVNPFSLRQDLNGGRCKLLDTPSKSVISLTFTLPALCDPCASPHLFRGLQSVRAPPRRCQSLPCTPELGRTVVLPNDKDGKDKETSEQDREKTNWAEEKEELHFEGVETSTVTEEVLGEELGLPVELDMVSLERLEEEDEEEEEESNSLTEPMDCTKSPEAASKPSAARPLLTSSSSSLQTNGWRLPISNGPPTLPPLPRLDNNNESSFGQWGGATVRANGYSAAPVFQSEPTEQDDVISCPGCCLVGLSLPSMCVRGTASVTAPRRRASLPRQRPYWNLNGTITGGSASSSAAAAATATKALLCRGTNGLAAPGASVPCEPGLSLPEAQT